MSTPRVLYLVPPGYPVEVFRSCCPAGWEFESLSAEYDRDEVRAKLGSADFVIQSSVVPLETADLEHAPRVRVVARQGVGVDKLDLGAFAERGVRVTICPEGTTEFVAEHTLMLMMAAGRQLVQVHADVSQHGGWPRTAYRRTSIGLHGNTVVVAGYGRIGRAVVDRLSAFGAEVVVVVRPERLKRATHPDPRVRFSADLGEALGAAEFVTLHVPLTPESRGMIGAAQLAAMRPGAFFINTSRGELVDELALLRALDDGQLGGAALDVAATEPPSADDPLRTHPRVLLTPHHAAGTRDSLAVKAATIFADLERVWNGREPAHLVN